MKVPQARPLIRRDALDWYVQRYNQMLKKIDTSLPMAKQLEMQDNAGEVLQAKALEVMREATLGCFIAGTLVHTKDGLKPIEQIQAGDWVLSKPENGGAQTYKRVLKTFEYPPKRVVRLGYVKPSNKPSKALRTVIPIIVTPNHPIWTIEDGWTAVGKLQGFGPESFHFEGKDGDSVDIWGVKNIYISDLPNVGWTSNQSPEDEQGGGSLWNYVEHKLVATNVLALEPVRHLEHPDPYLKLPVFNLEVEDFHTYYVGEHGIWVHNQNCGRIELRVQLN